ncbi:MAG: hypothetical protein KDI44_11995 [Thiothrix sp.]|nr:hypothetical protein [Thiothrix sp.]HPQ96059.1 hypothetical protein [Thiolinea sp.]
MTLTLVQAKEISPPPGKPPLIWRLVTNREVGTAAVAGELIDWYRARPDLSSPPPGTAQVRCAP